MLTTDVLFAEEPNPSVLTVATGHGFSVPVRSVVVAPLLSDVGRDAVDDPAVSVLWRRNPGDHPGEFPVRFILAIREEDEPTVFEQLIPVAKETGIAFVTEADDPYQSRLYLPDGTVRIIPDEDDDFAIRLRPQDRRALERARAATRVGRHTHVAS